MMLARMKEKYWNYHRKSRQRSLLASPENLVFSSYVRNQEKLVQAQLKKEDILSDDESLKEAIGWIFHAQEATPDGGVSR